MAWDLDRCTDVSHNSVINWVNQAAKQLPEPPPIQTIPDVGKMRSKLLLGQKNLIWLWTAVNHVKVYWLLY